MEAGLGRFLRELRFGRRMTMAQVAAQAVISRRTLIRWETGHSQPRLPELQAVLEALGAGAEQRRRALALVDAPRALVQVRQAAQAVASQIELGPLPLGGDLLRAMRLRTGRTLEEIAACVGVSPRAISSWERSEKRPSDEHLHALCFFFGVREEELTTLLCGRFALAPGGIAATASYGVIESGLWDYYRSANTPEKVALGDLTYLSLIAQCWPLATQGGRACILLADIYMEYANHLYLQRRFAECERASNHALDILPTPDPLVEEDQRHWEWAVSLAALRAAGAAMMRGGRRGARRGGEMLRYVLPVTTHPTYAAWLLADLGKIESRCGRTEESLALGRKAILTAERDERPYDLPFRQQDMAQLLLQAGRPQEALDTLEGPLRAGEPHPALHLLLAQVHLALGNDDDARDQWRRSHALLDARAPLDAHDVLYYRAEADALMERFQRLSGSFF